jgi:hypothetical protein
LNDVTRRDESQEPVVVKKEKHPGGLFGKQGAIVTELTLPKQTYRLGDTITFGAQVTNNSSVAVAKTKARFIQSVTYYAQGRTKEKSTTFVKVKQGPCPAGSVQKWENTPLVVPKTACPSDLGPRCTLIKVAHSIQV